MEVQEGTQESRGSRAGRRVTKVHFQGTGCSSKLLRNKGHFQTEGPLNQGSSSHSCSWDSQSFSLSWEDLQFPSLAFSCQLL